LSGGINVYGYGYGNPLAYADPNGLVPLVLTPCVTSPQAAMGCAALAWGAANAAANACSNAVDAIKDWMSSEVMIPIRKFMKASKGNMYEDIIILILEEVN
jgi:hypothetical protein